MAQTIWQEAEAKHRAASDALHAHLDKCSDCNADQGEFCEAARELLNACMRAPRFPPGADVIRGGQCPMQASTPMGCMFCTAGHMTECHAPLTCEQARCGHSKRCE